MLVSCLQLKKQAELTAAQQAAIEAKERAEAERKAKRQAELAEVLFVVALVPLIAVLAACCPAHLACFLTVQVLNSMALKLIADSKIKPPVNQRVCRHPQAHHLVSIVLHAGCCSAGAAGGCS